MKFDAKIINYVKDEIDYITFKKLEKFNLVQAFTVDKRYSFRTDKFNKIRVLEEAEYQKSISNYKKLCSMLDIPIQNLVKVNQEHTSNIMIVKKVGLNIEEYKNCDGLITNKKGVILGTVSADCIILFMYDPIKEVIANIHSGWRGSLEGIGLKAIEMMEKEFNSKIEDIIICFSPSIQRDCFLVDKDIRDIFYAKYNYLENIEKIIKPKGNKWVIDTVLLNKTLFLKRGIKLSNMVFSNICTKCNKDIMHSYRGSKGLGGLNTGLIMLK